MLENITVRKTQNDDVYAWSCEYRGIAYTGTVQIRDTESPVWTGDDAFDFTERAEILDFIDQRLEN